jgi:transposase
VIVDPAERIAELEAETARQRAVIADLTDKLQAMEARIQAMSRRLFGPSSERLHDPGQQALDLDGADRPFDVAAAVAETPAADPAPATNSPVRQRRRRRARLPEGVAVVERIIDVPEADRIGPGGIPLKHLADEVSERLHYVPSHFERHRLVRPIYGVPFTDAETAPRVVAPPPAFLVAKGLPTDELALHVLIAKYADHVPLHRQSAIWARQDVHLPRSTLCGWVGAVAERLRPVWDAIGAEVCSGPYLHLDDTPINVLARDRCSVGRLWTYAVPDAVHLRFTPSRAGCWPGDFLRDYRGAVIADAYAGHDALFRDGARTEIGCMAHVRRKFSDLRDQEPEALAMVRRIGGLYAIETDLRDAGADPAAILARRRRDAHPILADIRCHLDRLSGIFTPQHPLGRAVSYALNQWDACTRYADSGILPIDNNLAERSIRPVALGRKNYLFLGSGEEGGGDWAAIAYSILGSCALNRLDPYRYLLDITPALLRPGRVDHATLTPRMWAKRTRTIAI